MCPHSDKILYTFPFNALNSPTRQCYYPDFRNKETEREKSGEIVGQ